MHSLLQNQPKRFYLSGIDHAVRWAKYSEAKLKHLNTSDILRKDQPVALCENIYIV